MPTISIRFTDDEERKARQYLAASGEMHLGPHMKRIYFEAQQGGVAQVDSLRDELGAINEALRDLQAVAKSNKQDEDLPLTLLSAMYLLLWRSVPDASKITVDKAIDIDQIERFIRGGK